MNIDDIKKTFSGKLLQEDGYVAELIEEMIEDIKDGEDPNSVIPNGIITAWVNGAATALVAPGLISRDLGDTIESYNNAFEWIANLVEATQGDVDDDVLETRVRKILSRDDIKPVAQVKAVFFFESPN